MANKRGGSRPGSGRRRIVSDPVSILITFPGEHVAKMPKNRCDYIRDAVRVALLNDGLIDQPVKLF